MATLSPPHVLTRARSSSTAGNLTTARSRTGSSSAPQDPFALTQLAVHKDKAQLELDSSSTPSSSPPAQSRAMFDVLYTVAARVIPLHDALSSPNSSPKGKEKLDINIPSLTSITTHIDKTVAAAISEQTNTVVVQPGVVQPSRSKLLGHGTRRHPSPTLKSHRRNPSPFSSLFITPPPPELPPPVSSPRTSISFSRFSPIHIPTSPVVTVPAPKLVLPLLAVCSLFFITLLPVVFAVWSLPIASLKSLPKTVADIKILARELDAYGSASFQGAAHIFGVLALASIWKNAWSVPGSAVVNILAGALMNPILATLLQTILTTFGSICATLLSKPLAPIISHLFPRALSLTRTAFEGTPVSSPELSPVDMDSAQEKFTVRRDAPKRTPIWVRLTVLRLVGVVPWSALNLACGICDVPLWDCAVGGFIGMLPWTAVTCQIGDILQTLASSSSDASAETVSSLLTSPSIIAKLIFLSLLSLGPVLMRDRLSALISRTKRSSSSTEKREEEEAFMNEKFAS